MNNIVIHKDIRKSVLDFLQAHKYSKIVVIVDENTSKHCYGTLNFKDFLPDHTLIQIKSGETEKNLHTCEQIWLKMTEQELDRKSLVINLGGGVIGDMGGFCASTYKRGIDFIQIPTTLLSMVDASVGGKLGIDFHGFKNHIGVFKVPNAVLISTEFLATLPPAELRSGFAEVLKHCLIADAGMWAKITALDWKSLDFEALVSHSVNIKDHITTQDPTEKGLRKILNFGHTLGHAVESFFLGTPRKLLHGEAIAVGMICETFLSYKKGLVSQNDLEYIGQYLLRVYGKVELSSQQFADIIALTKQDKKNEYDEVQFALIGPIGKCGFGITMGDKEMKEALEYYRQLTTVN
jgi:3-dehydroquinate synthase